MRALAVAAVAVATLYAMVSHSPWMFFPGLVFVVAMESEK